VLLALAVALTVIRAKVRAEHAAEGGQLLARFSKILASVHKRPAPEMDRRGLLKD
jgi:hypothetical protein